MDMDLEEEPPQERAPKKRFRKNKLKIVFDREERSKFLLGFRKRKQERKEKYIEKLERDLAKEKKRIKGNTQRAVKKLSSSHSVLPEVKNIIDSMPEKEETYDLGNTLVKITSLDDQIYRHLPTIKEEDEDESDLEDLPKKRKSLLTDDEEDSDEEDLIKKVAKTDPFFNPINDSEILRSDDESEEEKIDYNYNPLEMLRKNTTSDEPADPNMSKQKLEREANRMLQQSDIFKKMQRIKQKKSKKFRMFRLQPSEKSEEGTSTSKGKGKNIFKKTKSKKGRGK